MRSILVDANLDGQGYVLDSKLRSEQWEEFRAHLDIRILYFEDVGLDRAATDEVVWRLCSRQRTLNILLLE